MIRTGPLTLSLLILMLTAGSLTAESKIKVGSKKFTEAVILGEMITQHLESHDLDVIHKAQLGGTRLLWKALNQGDLDIYADYTGTIIHEILQDESVSTLEEIREKLIPLGIDMTLALGFNNTYAMGVSQETRSKYNLRKISDLRKHPGLKFGFTNEFMDREDGWPSLEDHYKLPQTDVRGLDHDLAYKGLATGSIDLVDLYSTDAEIAYYNLAILEDDLHHFPDYQAVILFRQDLAESAKTFLKQFENTITEDAMVAMNSAVKIQGQTETEVASKFLVSTFGMQESATRETRFDRLLNSTKEHLLLVIISLGAAILVAIPLGVWGARNVRSGRIILSIVGVIQTIPSLALLVFMIPLLGIGGPPALMALFLYSLLPIVRNTLSGLNDISQEMKESAHALGLPEMARLRLIEMPLATRSILAGIKTSAVINVGTATLGALIGAGGYGQAILTGIRLDDTALILEGAIPAALLALLVQWAFDFAETFFLSPGLQITEEHTQ